MPQPALGAGPGPGAPQNFPVNLDLHMVQLQGDLHFSEQQKRDSLDRANALQAQLNDMTAEHARAATALTAALQKIERGKQAYGKDWDVPVVRRMVGFLLRHFDIIH